MTSGKNLTGPSKASTSLPSNLLEVLDTKFSSLEIIIFEKSPLNNKNNKKIIIAKKTSEKFIPPSPVSQTFPNNLVKLFIISMNLNIKLYP